MREKVVMIVDDTEDHREVVGAMLYALVGEDLVIKEAVNGQDALQKFDGKEALVISDLNMPHLRGIDLLRALREQGSKVPFILRSSLMENGVRREAKELGADCFSKLTEDDETFARAAQILKS